MACSRPCSGDGHLGSVEAPCRLGDVHHEVAGALDLRREADRGDHRAHVARHRLLAGQDREAALLDVEGEGVDLVVTVDELLRGGQVEVQRAPPCRA